jgi:O-succinylbenzoate synthase
VTVDLQVTRATVFRVPYPLRRPFVAVHQETSDRDVLVLRLDTDAGPGWSECPVLPTTGYGEDSTDSAQRALIEVLLPALLRAGSVSALTWDAVDTGTGHRAPRAAVEAALLDAECRAAGVSLATRLGATADTVSAGAAVGLGSVRDVLAEAESLVREGYGRIKVKIAPPNDSEMLVALRVAVGQSVELQADGNGVYSVSDTERLCGFESVGLSSLEQPFARDDLASHARLVAATSTPICLDESISSSVAVRAAREAGACGIVSIKWSRIGGVLESARLIGECRRMGLAVTIGGMLSSGLGRAVDVALAAVEGVTVTGDQSGSDRYCDFDLTEPSMVVGGQLPVPRGPGLGTEIDEDRIVSTAVAADVLTARG